MGFARKTWKDRMVEFAGRRSLTKVSGSADGTMIVDVARSEGNVSQAGDAFSAENMNDLEQRIEKVLGGFEFYDKLLTQAEYDALPAATKSTPKLLFVVRKG